VADQLEAELFANSWPTPHRAPAWERIGPRLDAVARNREPSPLVDWHVTRRLPHRSPARRGSEVMARFTRRWRGRGSDQAGLTPCGHRPACADLDDELEQALAVSDAVLADARARGSMNMVATCAACGR